MLLSISMPSPSKFTLSFASLWSSLIILTRWSLSPYQSIINYDTIISIILYTYII
jgi:hypothetical protein